MTIQNEGWLKRHDRDIENLYSESNDCKKDRREILLSLSSVRSSSKTNEEFLARLENSFDEHKANTDSKFDSLQESIEKGFRELTGQYQTLRDESLTIQGEKKGRALIIGGIVTTISVVGMLVTILVKLI